MVWGLQRSTPLAFVVYSKAKLKPLNRAQEGEGQTEIHREARQRGRYGPRVHKSRALPGLRYLKETCPRIWGEGKHLRQKHRPDKSSCRRLYHKKIGAAPGLHWVVDWVKKTNKNLVALGFFCAQNNGHQAEENGNLASLSPTQL